MSELENRMNQIGELNTPDLVVIALTCSIVNE